MSEAESEIVYEVFERIGDCMICKKREDLRCGACFTCSDQVSGEPLKSGKGHRLWETKNPDNTWYIGNPT